MENEINKTTTHFMDHSLVMRKRLMYVNELWAMSSVSYEPCFAGVKIGE